MKSHFLSVSSALALVLCATAAQAACDNVSEVLEQAYPGADESDDGWRITGGDYPKIVDPQSVSCKAWPANPALTLVTVPLLEDKDADDGEKRGNLDIIVADTKTKKPLARLVERGMADQDAIQSTFGLDTARYTLKPGLRAFGVTTEESGGGGLSGWSFGQTTLALYTYEKGRIARALDDVIIEQNRSEGGSSCGWTGTLVKRTLTMGGAGAGGYRDIVIDQTATNTVADKADCNKTHDEPGATRKFTLRYGNGSYHAPAAAQPADTDDGPSLFAKTVEAAAPKSQPAKTATNDLCTTVGERYKALLARSGKAISDPRNVLVNLANDPSSKVTQASALVDNVNADNLAAWAKAQTPPVALTPKLLGDIKANTDTRQRLERLPGTNFYVVNGTAGTASCYQAGVYFTVVNGEVKPAAAPQDWQVSEADACQIIRSYGMVDDTPVAIIEDGGPKGSDTNSLEITPWTGEGFGKTCTVSFRFDQQGQQLLGVTMK